MPSALLRILIVDDHTLFRRGLVALLLAEGGFEIVGEAGDAGEALRLAAATQPDVILLDNHLPGVRGVDALPSLLKAAPLARVVMLTVSESTGDLAAALRAGARGYLLKTVDSPALAQAIHRAMQGQSTVSPEMTGKLADAFQSVAAVLAPAPEPSHESSPLSPREQEIATLIARGASNKEIARELDIAETTVKIHVQHILRKLELSSRVQVAVWAAQRGDAGKG
jgi:two-component system nitrate/nitrite response regulator NarL